MASKLFPPCSRFQRLLLGLLGGRLREPLRGLLKILVEGCRLGLQTKAGSAEPENLKKCRAESLRIAIHLKTRYPPKCQVIGTLFCKWGHKYDGIIISYGEEITGVTKSKLRTCGLEIRFVELTRVSNLLNMLHNERHILNFSLCRHRSNSREPLLRSI